MVKEGKNRLDIICIGAVGIDSNVYLYSNQIDFKVEMNFSQIIDSVGQAGGYSSLIMNNFGLTTGLIGYVGDDFFGIYIKTIFLERKISTLWFIDPEGTKRSFNLMNKKGERKNFYDGKGSMDVKPDLVLCEKFLSQASMAHFNIVNWSRNLLPIAKKLGLIISCDIQDIVDLKDTYRTDFIIASDILFLSAINFENLDYLIKEIRKLNSEAVMVIGMGARGSALCFKDDEYTIYPPPELDLPLIDTNGAGDSLAMGFLFAYKILKKSLEESLLIGQINARFTCSMKTPKTNFLSKSVLLEHFEKLKVNYY